MRLHKFDETLEPFSRNASHAGEMLEHPDFKKIVALLADPAIPIATVCDYAVGQTWTLSCAALAALKQRTDGEQVAERIGNSFDVFSAWQMQFAFDYLVNLKTRMPAGAPLLACRDWWLENRPMQQAFLDYFEKLGDEDPGEPGPEVLSQPFAQRRLITQFLDKVRHPLSVRLAAKLGSDAGSDAGASGASPFLSSIGRFWPADAPQSALIEPIGWKDGLAAASRVVGRDPARPLMVIGEPMSGKTSFLKLLARVVSANGWRVFEASAADLQAGQLYIGQLEGRIRDTLQELDISRKIIWYVPDLLAFAMSGTHQSQSSSILDQILPALSSGRVMIWTEATPASMARLVQLRPALRRLIEAIRLEDMYADEAEELAQAVAAKLAPAPPGFDASFPKTAVDVAQHYLTAMSLPGSALSLMRLTALRLNKQKPQRLSGGDILETLSQMTGLPLSLLDGAERLELESIREFFSGRVIGQPEAVDAIVERIAMLKSGLNDPGKPIGVFLFAGPTGTGKTELAKTVAEYLFGSVDRMIRFDMSEFQTFDAISKILGGGGLPADADTLISRIRKQPFSLVLLDEFEKSHPQIWDLFLQVFDDGRLTDAYGQTADFRHCLIILTTNLGATAHRDSGMGFTPSAAHFTNDQIMRAISQTFRPEFQNRLDKVIVFKPLTRELMRGILKKELDRIFERRGLKDRAWAVEWDASALEFLLEKGFSPEMGARPLKRAIDQYLIAPLAATIVERRFPEGDQFVFVRRDGDALRAEFVDPDGDGEPAFIPGPTRDGRANEDNPSLFDMMAAPTGEREEALALRQALEPIAERIDDEAWTTIKADLSAKLNAPEFWTSPDRFITLGKIELMDRLAVAAETAHALQARLQRQKMGATAKSVRDLVARLAMQIHLVNEGLTDLDEETPAEAALMIEPVFNSPGEEGEAERAWCQQIEAMYRKWADKRNMSLTEIDMAKGASAVLLVSGFGAYRTLRREAGLHVLDGLESTETTSRMTARVLVAPVSSGASSKASLRQSLADTFKGAPRSSTIVRRYRLSPSPLVRTADGSWRSGKVDEVLAGNFDILR
ncbi:MAG: AAA family ATPase [Hyphomicrobium sp.]|nr:AAA family ATPase [Hyphomicrobium sp.]